MKFKSLGPIVQHAGTGLSLPEQLARRIDDLSKNLPKDFGYRRLANAAKDITTDPLPDGSKQDISTITTDAVDRDREVVLPDGIDLEEYRGNPVVLFAHDYSSLPIGKCIGITPKKGGLNARTQYASRPADHQGPWLPDTVHSLIQQGMLSGKSIGFIPMNMRGPTADEIKLRPELRDVRCVIDRAVLLEYSVCAVPCNAEALMTSVSKSLTEGTLDAKTADLLRKGLEAHKPAPAPVMTELRYDPESVKAARARLLKEQEQLINKAVADLLLDHLAVLSGAV
jgi:phage head maturation protease